jgi:hypothetical protein
LTDESRQHWLASQTHIRMDTVSPD